MSVDFNKCLSQLKKGEQIKENEIKIICDKAIEILQVEPNLVHLEAPITVCGDIHGQFYDLLELFQIGGNTPITNYLFLGDYVDRGYNSIETILYFMLLKILYPDRITLLRGNHECQQITMQYGFYEECRRKYNSINVWKYCCRVFNTMPLAALIENKIFCVHGGLSPNLENLDELTKLQRVKEIEHEGVISDILWSDPEEDMEGYRISPRGAGYLFGEDVVNTFEEINKIDLIARAHQLVMEGYKMMFGGKLVTIWSAPNYCYRCGNMASILKLDENLKQETIFFSAASVNDRRIPAKLPVPDYFL